MLIFAPVATDPGRFEDYGGRRNSMRASINLPRGTAARKLALILPPTNGGKGSGNRHPPFYLARQPPAVPIAKRLKISFGERALRGWFNPSAWPVKPYGPRTPQKAK